MFTQTFGVEVEMNHITRQNAARLAAGLFGTMNYRDTSRIDGYCAWSAWDAQGRKWKFVRDASIKGPESEKCELVTPILHYNDMALLQDLIRKLRKAGAVSNPSQGCGVHIHVGADGHTARTLTNLTNIMAAHEGLLIDALSLDPSRVRTYCQTVDLRFLKAVNEKKPQSMADLADIWYKSQDEDMCRNAHYNQSRYHMLNLHATFTKGTIEFRLFQFSNPGVNIRGERYRGGLHAGMLKSYIQLCLALSHRAKEARNSSPTVLVTDNPKYAMRCWLLRLGFIGDEFKTARDILTRNLAGNSAWRHGAATA